MTETHCVLVTWSPYIQYSFTVLMLLLIIFPLSQHHMNQRWSKNKCLPVTLIPWARSIRGAAERQGAGIRVCLHAVEKHSISWRDGRGLLSFASPDSSNDTLDWGQQVLHRDLTVTAPLVKAVVPGHVGVCCFGERRLLWDRDSDIRCFHIRLTTLNPQFTSATNEVCDFYHQSYLGYIGIDNNREITKIILLSCL